MIHGEADQDLSQFADSEIKMPALFLGHGSPTNAMEDNEFSRAWADAAKALPRPKAIICISAHWETSGTSVTAMDRPKTIHDFYGFPRELYEMRYPAPGSPALARLTSQIVHGVDIRADSDWGLDHGTWSVLSHMFPEAKIPVIQLSLDRTKSPEFHYELGAKLKSLRNKGILIVGSGNMVHNLGKVVWQETAYDWAIEFDTTMKGLMLSGDHDSIINYPKLGKAAQLSVPTNEHFLPLLYILALQDKKDVIHFFAEKVTLGSISMRSLRMG
jgi:4,5-DOPA dioxygenase extradiol